MMMLCLSGMQYTKAQTTLPKVYDEEINPLEQIDQAVAKAQSEGKFVICQVGGNWCPWCLRFADFITKDATISKMIDENFVYIHVNYNPRKEEGAEKMERSKARCFTFRIPVSWRKAKAIIRKRCSASLRIGYLKQ